MKTVSEIVYQIRLTPITFCKYTLAIGNKQMLLTFPQVLQLRQKIGELTSPLQLTKIIENNNFVLLFIADKKHLVYLDILQLLDLKEEVECFFCRF